MMRWIPSMVALAATILVATAAHAHMGSTKEVRLQVDQATVQAQVEVDALDASLALGLGLDATPDELRDHRTLVVGWLTRGLSVFPSSRGPWQPCPATAGEPRLRVRGPDTVISTPITFHCPADAGALTLRDSTVFADDPEHRTFVTVQASTADGASQQTHVLRAGAQELELTARPAATATAAAFVAEGAVHLVTGYDHVLFLLSLLLVAGLTVQRSGFRSALTDVAWVVTAFTVGHSASLGAAALGWVALPSQWVEVAIAASIVLVAGLNLVRPRVPTRATRRTRATIAGVFGLVHGFGFSSVLADVGLPASDRVLALLSFNVGIELAQLALVAMALIPLGLAARSHAYRRLVVQGGSAFIAAMGCIWVVERTLGG